MTELSITGRVFDVQRFAVHDGPGIRSTVFLQGCTARCAWCHNPESLESRTKLQYYPSRCIGCGCCERVCPQGAHRFEGEVHHFDRAKCSVCGQCAQECFAGALVMVGREETAEHIVNQVLEDRLYYEQSGGGVTLSGGEPVLQTAFTGAILRKLREEGVHTCLQTAGYYPYERIEPLLPYLNLIMFDVKAHSETLYRDYVHADRAQVFDNLHRLGDCGVPIIARTPCIHPLNDAPDEIEAIAKELATLPGLQHYTLIPYHGLGKAKYDALGDAFTAFSTPDADDLYELERLAARYVPVYNHEKGKIDPAPQ